MDKFLDEKRTGELWKQIHKKNTYSLQEVCIGVWIDGSPLYRIVYKTQTPSSSTGVMIVNNIPSGLSMVTDIRGIITNENAYNVYAPVPYYYDEQNAADIWVQENQIWMRIFEPVYFKCPMFAILEYTK